MYTGHRYSSSELHRFIPGDALTIVVPHDLYHLPKGTHTGSLVSCIRNRHCWLLRVALRAHSKKIISFRVYHAPVTASETVPYHGFINEDSHPCQFTHESNTEARLRHSLAAKGIPVDTCPECGELEYGQRHKCKADD